LSLLSGVGAVVVAIWSAAALRHLVLPNVRWAHSPIDLSTVGFIMAVSVVTGVIVGLAPAASTLSANVIESLKAGQRETGYHRSPLRSLLLVAQAALSVILLVGAGLFLQSFQNVRSIDVGYDVSNVVDLSPSFTQRSPEQELALRTGIPEVVRRLEHVSGVEAVGYANGAPFGSMLMAGLTIPDRDTIPRGPGGLVPSVNGVSESYFSAAGMRIVSGRAFATTDGAAGLHVAIVNETMARVVWPGEKAIGKCIIIGKRDGPCSTIVGIASDAHRLNVIEPAVMFVYFPVAQAPPAWLTPGNLVIRTRPGDLERVTSVARRELQAAIPSSDGVRVFRLADTVEQQLRPWRLGAVIFTAFGVLACIVAAVGVYSVVAYGVAQRTHEMGVRIALGAQAKQIIDLVLADGLRAVIIGVAIGIGASLLLGPLVRSLLFGVTPSDASSFIAAGVALCVLGAVASIVPALRAARVDPIIALRSE
jgi:putative ABC transport system permease protein